MDQGQHFWLGLNQDCVITASQVSEGTGQQPGTQFLVSSGDEPTLKKGEMITITAAASLGTALIIMGDESARRDPSLNFIV